MDSYHVLELVGEGSFGKVFRGRRKFTGQFVALKFVSKAGKSDAELRALRQEIAILRQLDHENIILLLDFFETPRDIVVVTEYAPHGELLNILKDDASLAEPTVRAIAAQLAGALHYLHSRRIMHRDMKPQNVLVSSNGVIKLADFGFARALSASTVLLTSIKGTPLYMAPEIYQDRRYDPSADAWGLGVMLFELATGTPPFYAPTLPALRKLIVASEPVRYPDSLSREARSFLELLLVRDPARRAGWDEILRHPWIVAGGADAAAARGGIAPDAEREESAALAAAAAALAVSIR
jgi:fused-like protein